MKEKEILEKLRSLISTKRNEYIDAINEHDPEDPYTHYCRGKKDMLEDIMLFIACEL